MKPFKILSTAFLLVLCGLVPHPDRSCRGSVGIPAAFAAPLSNTPLLRIETGQHTAIIPRIDLDGSGRWLVSASHDKTARVWDTRGGSLARILRPPIAPGKEGELYAGAISPNGELVACGGWTKSGSESGQTVYLFSRQDGRLVARAEDLTNVVLGMAFSPDGRYLAVTLGGKNGVRLFEVVAARTAPGRAAGQGGISLRLAAEDHDYGDSSYGVHFSPDGKQLVTSCDDGCLRSYGLAGLPSTVGRPEGDFPCELQPHLKRRLPQGQAPFVVKFSPDGSRVAASLANSGKALLLAGESLDLVGVLDPGDGAAAVSSGIAWSPDGRALYTASPCREGESCTVLRSWSAAGRKIAPDLKTGNSGAILDMASLPDGRLVLAGGAPSIVILRKDKVALSLSSPVTGDFRDNPEGLQLSPDGGTVRFAYQAFGKQPAAFSLSERKLTLNPESGITPLHPATRAGNLRLEGWENSPEPTLNGRRLPLDPNELSRCAALSADSGLAVVGGDWYLRGFDAFGRELWKAPAPGTVWSVNISRDGRLVLAAYGDGTLRWHRASDGKELLAFFPHADRKRWVLWTPGGYYDASPGGEELIGWHVNDGRDQAADFFPASRFRTVYYRPDVIANLLDSLDEARSVTLANAESGGRPVQAPIAALLPPVVSILSPEDGLVVSQSSVTLRFAVRAPDNAPVTAIRVLVNGRPLARGLGIELPAQNGAVQSVTLSIPEQSCEVSVIAENRHAFSQPAGVRLVWVAKQDPAQDFVIQPKLYLLAVGVSLYQDPDLALKFAAKDARDFAAALQLQKGGLYRDVHARVLTDAQATRDEILDGMDWLRKEVTSKDVGLIFLAGHGVNDQSGIYYYLPQNVNLEKIMRTGVAFSDIKNTLLSLAGKAVLFVDTCHSGNVMGTRRGVADINAVVNELSSAENGAVVFASSTGKQFSLENASWGNGAFTKALVEGISGKADYTGKGKITINMLDLYLSERVKQLTKGRQSPTSCKPQTIQDFPLAVKLGAS